MPSVPPRTGRRPTLRGARTALARLPPVFGHPRPVFRKGPRAQMAALRLPHRPQFPPPPPQWQNKPLTEWAVYWVLTSVLKKVENIHFGYQDPVFRGRQGLGGIVIDFIMYDPPGIAINPLGLFFHYDRGAATLARDNLQKAQLAAIGYQEIFIDEPLDYNTWDVIFYVKEALRGVDHSAHRLGGF